jgi:hypothetical protein
MKRTPGGRLRALAACGALLFAGQPGPARAQTSATPDDALTVTEFCAKGEEEQVRIVGRLLAKGLTELTPGVEESGAAKSAEKLKKHRAMSELIRSHFKSPGRSGPAGQLEVEPSATLRIRGYATYALKANPGQLVWNVVVIYVKDQFDKHYTKQTAVWKAKFEGWTTEQRVSHFGSEWRKELINAYVKVLDDKIAVLDKRAKELEVEAVVEGLKLGARPSKANPSKVVLVLKNDTKYAAAFELKCEPDAKAVPVSVAANGVKEVGAVRGAGRDYAAGERCEFRSDGKPLRTFFTASEKTLAGTAWDCDEYELSFNADHAEIDDYDVIYEKGTYTVRGNLVLIEFPDETFEGTITGDRMLITVTSKKTKKTSMMVAEKSK